ncbi:MAG: hypothetical protein AB8B57_07265 [Congregibacter sp.]
MARNSIDAMFLDSGTGLEYFTGVRSGRCERMLAAIIPGKGDVKYGSPGMPHRTGHGIGMDGHEWGGQAAPHLR